MIESGGLIYKDLITCKGCRTTFVGGVRDGYCVVCWPIVAEARTSLLKEIREAVKASIRAHECCFDNTCTVLRDALDCIDRIAAKYEGEK